MFIQEIFLTFFVLTLFTFLSSQEKVCEDVRFSKRNKSMQCCYSDDHSAQNNESVTEISLYINGTLYQCEEVSDFNENFTMKSINKSSDDIPTNMNNMRTKNEENVMLNLPLNLTNRNFGDVPTRCPQGKIMDSEGECVEVWD